METEQLTPDQEQRLADYLAGKLEETERQAFESELLRNDRLAEAMYTQVNIATSIEESQAIETAGERIEVSSAAIAERAQPAPFADRRISTTPWWQTIFDFSWLRSLQPQLVLPAAMAAVLLIAVLPQLAPPPDDPSAPTYRGEPGRPQAIEPAGPVNAWPEAFTWTPDPAAESYRFELFDAELHPLFQTVTTATSLAIPAADWPELRHGYWRVVPLAATALERPPMPLTAFEIPAP